MRKSKAQIIFALYAKTEIIIFLVVAQTACVFGTARLGHAGAGHIQISSNCQHHLPPRRLGRRAGQAGLGREKEKQCRFHRKFESQPLINSLSFLFVLLCFLLFVVVLGRGCLPGPHFQVEKILFPNFLPGNADLCLMVPFDCLQPAGIVVVIINLD